MIVSMIETKWLTAKEASQYCYENGIPRSVKSLRRWCANSDIEAQKRQVSNKQKWFIDRASLDIKIQEELEFLKHSEKPRPQPEMSLGHAPNISGHERTQADTPGHERTQPDAPNLPQIRDLEDQILLLKNDIKWRDQLLKDQKNTNTILMDEVKGQSRYIGHLETNVLRLGGNTDQAFLAAPVPKSGVSEPVDNRVQIPASEIIQNERPHPDQTNLYTG